MTSRLLLPVLLLNLLAPLGRGAEFDIKVDRLSPRVAVFSGGPWANAIVAVATPKGIVVVDAPFSRTIAGGFRAAIQTEFKRTDFACLINTHEHTCHVSGNDAYADLPIVGHASIRADMLRSMTDPTHKFSVASLQKLCVSQVENARTYFEKNDPARLKTPGWTDYEKCWRLIADDLAHGHVTVPPTITFDRQMTLYFGDVTVRLDYFGCAHGVGDTIVSFPEEDLVVTGGIFYAQLVPIISPSEAITAHIVDNWFVVLHDLLARTDGQTRFLASHSATPMTKAQIQSFVSYLEGLWGEVRRAKSGGETIAQLKTRLPLAARFPEMAKLNNSNLLGTEWEIRDIHGQNIDMLWKTLAN
jgi:glyoxylase-like metal-dependent hydrolase (beta-lactamase superfamily II)